MFRLIQKMRYTGRFRADMKGANAVFYLKVRLCDPFMLAQVFNPGFEEETFRETVRLRRIGEKPPVRRAVAGCA